MAEVRPKGYKPQITRPVRVGMISLGCAKNLVDGETMLGHLERAGVERVSPDGEPFDPNVAEALRVPIQIIPERSSSSERTWLWLRLLASLGSRRSTSKP